MKSKIWAGKYVTLQKLASKYDPSFAVAVNKEGSIHKLALKAEKTEQPANIFQWFRLFATYASVRMQRFPTEGQALLTYAVRIMDMQRSYGGFVWRSYDERFRQLKAVMPSLAWHKINWDICMEVINSTNPLLKAMPSQQKQANNQPFRSGSVPKGYCFRYNKGFCSNMQCRYSHKCGKCEGNHPLQKCPQKAQSFRRDNSAKSE